MRIQLRQHIAFAPAGSTSSSDGGRCQAVDLATGSCGRGGRVVVLGIAGEGKVLELPPDRIMLGDME
jgi:hypothetical protein